MTDDLPNNPALLPAGLRDLLPPDAETEASAVEAIMDVFAAHGYQRVKPPLIEFEDSLLAGSGAAVGGEDRSVVFGEEGVEFSLAFALGHALFALDVDACVAAFGREEVC